MVLYVPHPVCLPAVNMPLASHLLRVQPGLLLAISTPMPPGPTLHSVACPSPWPVLPPTQHEQVPYGLLQGKR